MPQFCCSFGFQNCAGKYHHSAVNSLSFQVLCSFKALAVMALHSTLLSAVFINSLPSKFACVLKKPPNIHISFFLFLSFLYLPSNCQVFEALPSHHVPKKLHMPFPIWALYLFPLFSKLPHCLCHGILIILLKNHISAACTRWSCIQAIG